MLNLIQEQFFSHPMNRYGVRELARLTNIDTKTVMKYLKELVNTKIILKKENKGAYAYYEANRLSYIYRYEKSDVLIKKIMHNGLIDYLENKLHPKVIVLFGSVKKGTYHSGSDVDIFIQAEYKKLNLHKFNKEIGHRIQLFYEQDLHKLNQGLLENIYNGLVLAGKLELFHETKRI